VGWFKPPGTTNIESEHTRKPWSCSRLIGVIVTPESHRGAPAIVVVWSNPMTEDSTTESDRERVSAADRYREYWAYLRHIETLRFTLVGVIVTVANAILVAVNLNPWGQNSPDFTLWVLGFLAVFVGVATSFLVAHKKSYQAYFDELKDMDEGLQDFGRRGTFEVLLVLVSLSQFAIVGSALTVDSSGSSWVMVVATGSLLVPWAYHLSGDRRTGGYDQTSKKPG